MKRILSILFALLLVFSLSACEWQNNVSAWYNSEKAKSDASDGYLGSWVSGEKYDACYDREIIIHSISETEVNFDILYYRTWTYSNVIAELKSDNKAYFLTEDGVEGNFYILNNKLVCTISQSAKDYVNEETISYLKDKSDKIVAEADSSTDEKIVNTKIPYEAICGAIIVGEDSVGNKFYRRKCEKCGWSSDTLLIIGPSYEFHCPECYNEQTVKIKYDENANSSIDEKKYKQYCYYTASRNTVILSQSPDPGECKYKVQCEKCGTLSVNTYTFAAYNSYGYDFNFDKCKVCGHNTCGYIDVRTEAVEN